MSQQSYGRQPVSNPDPSPVVAEPPERPSAAELGGSTGQPDPTALRDRFAEALKQAGDRESSLQFNLRYWGPVADQILQQFDITERPDGPTGGRTMSQVVHAMPHPPSQPRTLCGRRPGEVAFSVDPRYVNCPDCICNGDSEMAGE